MIKKARTKKQQQCWDRMREWVETNGIRPEPFGATITSFCKHFDINIDTYADWMRDFSEFSEMIKKANEVFSSKIVQECKMGLRKLCSGYEVWEEFQEGISDSNGSIQVKKVSRRKKVVPPNLGAITFVLCNRNPDEWTNPLKIDAKVSGSVEVIKGLSPDKAKEYLDKINDIE